MWLRSVPWSQPVWHLFRTSNGEEMINTKTKPINSQLVQPLFQLLDLYYTKLCLELALDDNCCAQRHQAFCKHTVREFVMAMTLAR